MEKAFPCNSCGLCCQNISGIQALRHLDNGQGVCIHLEGNRCSIYESRPEVCRVELMYKKYYNQSFDWDSFVLENLKVCKELQEKAGIPASLQVKLL